MREYGALLSAIAVFLIGGAISVHAQTPTPTSGASTPDSPSGVQLNIAAKSVSWIDNSDNETGFRIELTVNGVTATYEVSANVTSFQLPAGPIDAECGSFRVSVSAFNTSGASEADSASLVLECPLTTPTVAAVTPTRPPTLPSTGTGGGPDSSNWAVAAITVIAVAVTLFGTVAAARSVRRRAP